MEVLNEDVVGESAEEVLEGKLNNQGRLGL